ncbi:hypothetical protein IH773_27875, partial [Escherichia coli]|nr:hypothetical protein [Escherichia coli]
LRAAQRQRIDQAVGEGDGLMRRQLAADLFANVAADAQDLVAAVGGIVDV